MTYYTNKQIFYVNSANRLTGTDSNFSYYFNIDMNNPYDRVVVLSASIPKSYYLLTTLINTFTLTENGSSVTITMQPGNYTRSSMASQLTTLLNSNSPNHYTYVITYNSISTNYDKGIYYFTVTGNAGVQPTFTFTTGMYEVLGFNKNSTNNFSGSALQSVNVTNLSTETTLYIHSDIVQNNEGDNVLQEIYTSGDSSFSYVTFVNPIPHEYSKKLKSSTTNVFNFVLSDENENEINTNGVNINFTIMIYKQNDISNLIKGYIKYKTLNDSNYSENNNLQP